MDTAASQTFSEVHCLQKQTSRWGNLVITATEDSQLNHSESLDQRYSLERHCANVCAAPQVWTPSVSFGFAEEDEASLLWIQHHPCILQKHIYVSVEECHEQSLFFRKNDLSTANSLTEVRGRVTDAKASVDCIYLDWGDCFPELLGTRSPEASQHQYLHLGSMTISYSLRCPHYTEIKFLVLEFRPICDLYWERSGELETAFFFSLSLSLL